MKAGIVHAKNDIRYEDINQPVPKDNEVLIKVKYTGICGSDVPRVNGDACHFFPNVLGHEFSGTIEAMGQNVTSFEKGSFRRTEPRPERAGIGWCRTVHGGL